MCGIAGEIRFDGRPVETEPLVAMRDAMHHRGPDDGGLFTDAGVGLAHRRLSIIDLSPAGHQPMSNEDRRLWVVFNGEIYNFESLRDDLLSKGHVFRSNSDTEVILHAYEEWGTDCLERFRGMWAFALWDRVEGELFCARDRIGIKPFYYYQDDSHFLFASEIKALLTRPEVPRAENRRSLYRLLKFGLLDTDESTCFAGIRQLLPAHWMKVRDGRIRVRKYWEPPVVESADLQGKEAVCASRFRELLTDSVRFHLRSDVPVGACLSGGLDSSALVALAAPMLESPLRTCSVIYPGTMENEQEYVEAVLARTENLEPYVAHPTGSDLFSVLQRAVWHFDEPIWSPSVYSWWNVMQLVRDCDLKVVINGQGGDELLAGYPIYYPTYLRQLLRTARLSGFRRELDRYCAVMGIRQRTALRYLATPYWPSRLRRWFNSVGLADSYDEAYLRDDFCRDGERGSPRERTRRFRRYSNLREHLLDEFQASRLPMLLHAEDRFSMAFSIESRVPFLDHRLVEFCFRVPAEQKLQNGTTKLLLRRGLADVLPRKVLDRSDKKGYATPVVSWLREQLVEPAADILHSRSFAARGIFQADLVRKRFARFRRGEIEMPELTRCLSVELWLRAFIDRLPEFPSVQK
jgi:asparagine synthase (glutamine-hydrolysing)